LDGNNQYWVCIEDDGVGISPKRTPDKDMHFGLSIMRERAQRLNGNVIVEKLPERGTRVLLTFPAPKKEGGI
jgi:two-component system nitrate/nitrite sensor histidine kinase NarX